MTGARKQWAMDNILFISASKKNVAAVRRVSQARLGRPHEDFQASDMLKKANGDLVRRQNRGLVLATLRQHGSMARIGLGQATGLSPASITSITGELLEERLIRYGGGEEFIRALSQRGRPQTFVELNPAATHVLAVSISVDGVELVFADFTGKPRPSIKLPLDTYGVAAEDFAPRIAKEIEHYAAAQRLPLRQIKRIGISIQGVADTIKGEIAWSPAFEARHIPVVEPLERLLGISCSISNNANRIADALLARDRGLYGGTTAAVFLGHGVGLGLILNGTVFSGTSGRAAEFGHTNHAPDGPLCRCGKRGCLEAYSADYGLLRMADPKRADIHAAVADADILALEAAAERGEPAALAAYRMGGEVLGYGLARLIALINPSRVVFAGPGTRAFHFMEKGLHEALERGLVHDLRREATFEVMPHDDDMIISGTLMETLQHLDRKDFAIRKPPAGQAKARKSA
jgi:predicted NBD/HSP70 family sugar kinase